jgi:endonuclease/exonuclease/phosphatase family metal-dependent hydrolase
MKRTFFVIAAGMLLLLGLGLGVFWADSGTRSTDDLAQRTEYSTTTPSAARDTFTVTTYNLGHLTGLPDSSRTRAGRRSALNRATALLQRTDADFIGLQEVDFGLSSSAIDSMAERLGMKSAAQAVRWNDRYSPYAPEFGPITSGQSILSRYSIRRHVRTQVKDSSRSFWSGMFRPESVVQTVAIGIGGWPLFVMNINLDAPDVSTRKQHAREVNRLYRRLSSLGMPVLIIGSIDGPRSGAAALASDGTMSSESETVELLLRGTSLQPAFFAEGARVTGQSVATHPADNPRRKIDYIFYRPGRIAPTDANIRCGEAPPPSDHCAVTLSFLLPRPLDRLPEKRIPDDRLPSLDSLLNVAPKG